ncbi:hypothetical protein F5Y15DRAFT_421837 [Xylariaceae sp. FL0016]|nr:hypothetical protein F5Y15DRAFT_421837 [Xylariaceae sp. FL0016]
MATMTETRSTFGAMGMWGGTKDGKEDGYIDYSCGKSNMKEFAKVPMKVMDMRTLPSKPTWKTLGYELVEHNTSLSTEQFLAGPSDEGKATIKTTYFDEVAALIQEATGSSEVHPYGFRVRQEPGALAQFNAEKSFEQPGRVAHVDRDTAAASARVRDELGPEVADALLARHRRFAMVNVWRPVGNPARRWPLCFANHEGVGEGWSYERSFGRLFRVNDPNGYQIGDVNYDCVLKPDPRLTFHYASDIQTDEAYVFSSFDSDVSKVAPHGAFWDQNTPGDAPPRASIEVRSWVFLDPIS